MTLPRVTIVMTTYQPQYAGQQRRDAAWRAVESWKKYLTYEGELALHVADDGSIGSWGSSVDSEPCTWWPDATFSRQESHGVGASLNAGLKQAFIDDGLALYLVDDWELIRELDLTDWVRFLVERDEIGLMRFGPPHPVIAGHIGAFTRPGSPHDGFLFNLRADWTLLLEGGYCYSMRPALYHPRFIERWGWFDEDTDAIYCEKLYNDRWIAGDGKDIALAIVELWRHVASVELALVNPASARE